MESLEVAESQPYDEQHEAILQGSPAEFLTTRQQLSEVRHARFLSLPVVIVAIVMPLVHQKPLEHQTRTILARQHAHDIKFLSHNELNLPVCRVSDRKCQR